MQLWVVTFLALSLLSAATSWAAAAIKASPVAVVFAYQQGAAALPTVQTLSVAPLSGTASILVNVTTGGSQWLVVSPVAGRTNLAVTVAVNPTSLAVGQYSETITLTTPEAAGDPVQVPITLTVRAAPSDLKLTPTNLTATYRLGDVYTEPPVQYLHLTTTGGLLAYTAVPTGTKWLSVDPPTGAVFPGFRTSLTLNVNATGLIPGAYKGTITVSAPTAVTKTATVPFTLTVLPGKPIVTSLWPPKVPMGSPNTSITVTGSRFYTGTTVKIGAVALKTVFLGEKALIVTVPANLMATAGPLVFTVSNPESGGGTADPIHLLVMPPGPIPLAFVNGASQKPSSVAPGMLLTIYGSGLGPDTLVAFDGNAGGVATTLAGTRVYIEGRAVPIIYTSDRQVSVAAPNSLKPDKTFFIQLEYNNIQSEPLPGVSVAAAPALFTADGSGAGQAAAFQIDPATSSISLNSDKVPAAKGSALTLYATGAGVPLPVLPDGQIPDVGSTNNLPDVTLLLGDVPADVQYVGVAPGLLPGIIQINAVIPPTSPVGKAVPVTLKVGAATSPPGVTVSLK